MALANSLTDREQAKFVELTGGAVAVRLVGITGVFTATDEPRNDKEHGKFVETAAGDTAVRVVVS